MTDRSANPLRETQRPAVSFALTDGSVYAKARANFEAVAQNSMRVIVQVTIFR
jgi:hypothetical protein